MLSRPSAIGRGEVKYFSIGEVILEDCLLTAFPALWVTEPVVAGTAWEVRDSVPKPLSCISFLWPMSLAAPKVAMSASPPPPASSSIALDIQMSLS